MLGRAYVRGVQSRGVAANAKHYVLNHQETDRTTTSAYASDRTLFEVYYPPFRAAVEAGVASFMCAYNRINGTYACNNQHTLGHLRSEMGFRGWVVSDWWAMHSFKESIAAGLDVAMPGNDGYYTRSHLNRMAGARRTAAHTARAAVPRLRIARCLPATVVLALFACRAPHRCSFAARSRRL